MMKICACEKEILTEADQYYIIPVNNYEVNCGCKDRQLQAYKEAVEVMREALEFYGDAEKNWETTASLQWSVILPSDTEHIGISGMKIRGGKRARQPLNHEAVKRVLG